MAQKSKKELNFEQKHMEDLQRLQGFRLLDDDFMSKVFEDKKCTEFLLQIILNRKDLRVESIQVQYDIKNLQGRSIRLDILAIDIKGRVYNIEIQRNDKGAGVKRARYNSSLIDANITEPGDKYQNLNEIIYVFLTIFLYLLKCPQSLILSALRAFCFCGKPHISRSIFLYFRYQTWLKSW